ncbi:unnamed protein product [Musa acuminata subsp. burmannicoides]
MQIFRDRKNKKIWLSREKYIKNILERFSMSNAKPIVFVCHNEVSLVNSSCSGIGCCRGSSIPKDLAYYEVWFDSNFSSSSIWNFGRCSYAVLLEANRFEFLTSYITTDRFLNDSSSKAPLVVDWAIGNETCEVAQRNITSYACISEHSECLNSSNGPGYLCNCSEWLPW